MVIGIDISQIVYKGTGVGRYVEELVRELIEQNDSHKYVLFGASLRQQHVFRDFFLSLPPESQKKTTIRILPLPPTVLTILWNRFHIIPVEWIIGEIDLFWSSDWTQPPLRQAKGITTIHDLTVFRFPESFARKIVDVQKRKLKLSKIECSFFLCDSEATKKDAYEILEIPLNKMAVVYPGYKI